MIVEAGEKIHVVVRRKFEHDIRRHYLGQVAHAEGSVVRIKCWVYVLDPVKNEFVSKKEVRSTVLDLSLADYITNFIPKEVKLDTLSYTYSKENRLVLSDSNSFSLDINEFSVKR